MQKVLIPTVANLNDLGKKNGQLRRAGRYGSLERVGRKIRRKLVQGGILIYAKRDLLD